MKKRLLTLMMAFAIILGAISPLSVNAQAAQETKKINIIHVNDVHARATEDEKNKNIGYAKLKTYRDSIENSILLDAGDSLHGTTFATISSGKSIIDLMNAVGFDAMVPGNHDFNYGYERLVELSKDAKFKVLSANVVDSNDKTILEPSTIIEKNGVKIGIFGLSTPETQTKSNPKNTEGLKFADYIETANAQVKKLKDDGAEVIIALVHLGLDEASTERSDILAEKVEGIDVIIDGHSHTLLDEGRMVNGVLIAQTGEHMKNIGKVEISVKDGKVVEKQASLVGLADLNDIKPDEKILAEIEKVEESNRPTLEKVIGKTEVNLDGERENVRTSQTNLGNLLTDAMLDVSKADVAIVNGGGIRASIPAGDIKNEHVITSFPFTNYPVVIEVTGQTIVDALEFGVDSAPEVVGKFPHVGGMTFKYDINRPAKNRVFDVKIKNEDIDLNKTYKLVTNDFMAIGGDGYEMFKGAKEVALYPLLSEVLADYIEAKGTIKESDVNEVRSEVASMPDELKKEDTAVFTDIEGHWAEEFIKTATDKKFFNGMTETLFAPDVKITRAMLVTVLGRSEEAKNSEFKSETDKTFTDVTDKDAWYTKYVNWAAENGIVKGYEDGSFKPEAEVTREEMASIISRYKLAEQKPAENMDFTDGNSISDWALEDVSKVVGAGIMEGRADKSFGPRDSTTRAELAKIIVTIEK